MKTNKLVTHTVGKSNLYDKDKFKDGVYFAKDSKEIILNGISYGASDIKWENVVNPSITPVNTIYLKNVKDIVLLDGVHVGDPDLPSFSPILIKLENQKPFEGIAEIIVGDKSEKVLISGKGLNYSLETESDAIVVIKPTLSVANRSLRIPDYIENHIDKIELSDMNGKIVSFLRPNYIYSPNPPQGPVVKFNYVLNKEGLPLESLSFLGEEVDASLISKFSELGQYSFYQSKINGDLNITENQTAKEYSFEAARVNGSTSIKSNNKKIHEGAFSVLRSPISNLELNNTEVIETKAFSYSTIKVDSLKLPDTLKVIKSNAFSGCDMNIPVLNIPKSVVELGKNSFIRNSIAEVNVFETVENIPFAFDPGTKINRLPVQHIKINFDLEDIGENYKATVVYNINSKIEGLQGSVNNTFYSDSERTVFNLAKDDFIRFIANKNYFDIDDTIKPGAFKIGAGLKISPNKNQDPIKGSLHISLEATDYNNQTIVYSPFREIIGLNSNSEITYTYSVEKADIAGIDSLTIVGLDNYPEGVKEIAPFAYSAGLDLITDLNLPDTLKIIHPHAFIGMYSGGDIIIPDGVELIKKDAFIDMRTMNPDKKVKVLVNKNTVIEDEAFSTYSYEIVYK